MNINEIISEYEILYGSRISALDQISCLLSNDMFLISQKQFKDDKTNRYISKKLEYCELSSQLYKDLSSAYKFNSMAYESSADYSFKKHSHNYYNYVEFENIYNDSNTTEIAQIKIDGIIHSVKIPLPIYPTLPEPTPGEIKFFGFANNSVIDVDSPDFDGWVYADGSQYKISDFKYAQYFDQVDANYFRVPNLTEMLYIDNSINESTGDDILPYENDIGRHSHVVKMQLSGSISGSLTYKHGKYENKTGHTGTHGSDQNKVGDAVIDMMLDMSNVNLDLTNKIRSVSENSKTTHPSYKFVPFKIYIGVKTS